AARAAAAPRLVGIGLVCWNRLLRLQRFPEPDGAARILEEREEPGGMAAIALAAAARLGARAELWSLAGDDARGRAAVEGLAGAGVDVSQVRCIPGGRTASSVGLIAPDGRRSFLNARAEGLAARQAAFDFERLRGAGALLLEGYLPAASLAAAARARALGIPVVVDLNDLWWRNEPIARAADHLVLPGFAASDRFGVAEPADALPAMRALGPCVAGVTLGERGVAFLDDVDGEKRIWRHGGFRVRAIDTAGAGDVFHGAYALALAEGRPLEERLRFACGAAAIAVRAFGVFEGLPGRTDLEEFLRERGQEGMA
ncbi:MAG: hypothetical protein JXP34_03595, partial [Planctomycetes bacterium]|nr:hypothetical protein [Planctomycetota bacterium]